MMRSRAADASRITTGDNASASKPREVVKITTLSQFLVSYVSRSVSELAATALTSIVRLSLGKVVTTRLAYRYSIWDFCLCPSGERLVIRERRHWAVLLKVLLSTVGIVVGTYLLSQLASGVADGLPLLQLVLWSIAGVAVVRLTWEVLEWWKNIIVVTIGDSWSVAESSRGQVVCCRSRSGTT
jgi:hypothetical protein